MTDADDFTVMGPAPSSSDNTMSGMNPPSFITNHTKKVQYRDALRTWADIIRSFARVDPKTNAKLEPMGLLIYLACDDEAKAKLRAEETEHHLNLKGMEGDADRFKLIEK